MKDPAKYDKYSVKLRRPLLGLLPGRLWGKWINQDNYTEYSRKWVTQRFGKKWSKKLSDECYSETFEIHGWDGVGEEWEPLSAWVIRHNNRMEMMYRNLEADREDEEREAENRSFQRSAAATPEAVAEWMGRVRTLSRPKPGLGEGAVHLVDHLPGYREEVALLILRKYDGREDIYPDDLRNHLKNGRKRTAGCRFCSLPE